MNRMRALLRLLLVVLPWNMAHAAANPEQLLQQYSPVLHREYVAFAAYHVQLRTYATNQGFTLPVENLATVVHEIIHIASAAHQGYLIDGIYYEPYLRRDAWPTLGNKDMAAYIPDRERGNIYNSYVLSTPQNHLGNIVDEINAYGHVAAFVCRYEPAAAGKQTTNLMGFLQLEESYLRTLRTRQPAEYRRLVANKEARGALLLATQRAWDALRACGVPENQIPTIEGNLL